MKKNCTPVLLCALLWAFSNTASAQNNALSFDGTNYVSVNSASTVPFGADFTVEFWAYIPAYTSGRHEFVSTGGFGTAFYIGYDGDDPVHPILAGDGWTTDGVTGTPGTTIGTTGVTMPVGKWTHLALVCNSGSYSATLYINGILAATSSTTGTYFVFGDGSSTLQMGNNYDVTFPELMIGGIDELRIWNTQRTGAQIRAGMYGTVDPASAGLLGYYNMNDNTNPPTVPNNSTSPDSYANLSTPDGAWAGTASWAASPIQASDNSLTFAGTAGSSAQVTIPGNAAYDLSSGGTIEMYVYPTGLTSAWSTLIGTPATTNSQYIFQVNNSSIALYDGSSRTSFNYALPANQWSHLAFVYDNTTGITSVYYNKQVAPIGTLTGAFSGTHPGQDLTLGVTNNPSNPSSDPFPGALDEVRIWSTPQSQSAISANIYAPLVGNEAGLAGLFTFNQGAPGGDNQYLLTTLDNTANMNDATLANFGLTSSSVSNFTGHAIVPLPVNFTAFTATAGKGQALLQWQTAQEQNSRDFTIERSTDGVKYSDIGSVEAAGNSTNTSDYSFIDGAPVIGRNYYRLRETDLDGAYMYSDVRILTFSGTEGDQKLVWFQTGDKAVEVDLKSGSNEIYSVTDINGRLIQQGQLSSGRLYLSGQPSGIYVVKVITVTGKQLSTQVLVK
ncbi:MAG: LamG-like jellyroll fold domain-containing protein [Bacteroidota bacterium]